MDNQTEQIRKYVTEDEYFGEWTLEQFAAFDKFLVERAIPANAFVIKVVLPSGGFAWVLFQGLTEVDMKAGKIRVGIQKGFIPDDPKARLECPRAWQEYPTFYPNPTD